MSVEGRNIIPLAHALVRVGASLKPEKVKRMGEHLHHSRDVGSDLEAIMLNMPMA
jgi:hypothetical protein